MKLKTTVLGLILIAAVLLTACTAGSAAPEAMADTPAEETMGEMTSEEVMMDKPTATAMMEKATPEAMMDQPTPEAMQEEATPHAAMDQSTPEAMMDDSMAMPDWFGVSLTDVSSGESFTISDLKGKVVLVETMAMWCSNCLRQQKQVLELHDTLGERDDFVSLGLDIDPNEVGQALQAYTEKNGFYWRYAISPAEVSREIGQLYGDQFLNPPSTPMLIIDRHGEAHPLPFGIKDASSLMEALEPFLAEGM